MSIDFKLLKLNTIFLIPFSLTILVTFLFNLFIVYETKDELSAIRILNLR